MLIKSAKLITMAALLSAAAQTASAQEKSGNHTLGSANDVWRIELRNLEKFLAMSVGDSDGVGELRHIKIGLSGPDGQKHYVTEMNPFLQVNGGNRTTRNSINVRRGDRVSLDRLDPARGVTDTYNLWIHAKERPQGDLGLTLLNFEITVAARELDCFRDRVCRRGSTGTITYFVSVPVPSVRSYQCSAGNSYRILAVDGSQMRLVPMSSGRRNPRQNIEVRSENSGGHTISLGARGRSSRMELAMQSGEICIASTTRRRRRPR